MSEFKMPSLGADMEAGTLVEWMKKPGDRLQRGDAIAAVETQKGAIEIQTYQPGVLERTLIQIGERVPVGTTIAIIREDGQTPTPEASAVSAVGVSPPPETAMAAKPAMATSAPAAPAAEQIAFDAPIPAAASATNSVAKVTPAALRRAQQAGLDISVLTAAADGVIGLREVDAALAARTGAMTQTIEPPPSAASPPVAMPGLNVGEMRKAIAAAMQRSWREIPHYFVSSTFDAEPMLVWLERENAQRAVSARWHYAVPLIKAVALSLKATPMLNGHFGERGFEPAGQVNLGIAVALRGGGLIAPAILDTDRLDLDTLMASLDDLVTRVRNGRLRSSEMSMATATLTILGEHTADALQPVIYPPQVAIVACGQIAERAWARDNALSARRTLTVTVGGDHRASDGRSAAKFLARLDDYLQHPERL